MISRDGANISLWQDMPAYIARRSMKKGQLFDVCIAGGGITGLSTALALQSAGKQCVVVEARNICFGTTGGTTAHINTLMDTPYLTIINKFGKDNAALVHMAAEDAVALIKNNIRRYRIDCEFEDAIAFMFSQSKAQEKELDELYEVCSSLGLEIAYSSNIPVRIPFGKAIKIGRQAKFNPVKYVYGLAKAFEEKGGTIVQACRVRGFEENGLITVHSEKGNILCDNLVFATHIPPGVTSFNLRCAPYRSYSMAVELDKTDYPEGLVYDMYDPYHYYRSQRVNDRNYLIAGGEDHKTGHEKNTDARFLALEVRIMPVRFISSNLFAPT